ncbi:hypothetical protein [Rubrolithibacter danxiaensis]|uniref:hypothetical protein n=1 Tax=Rubrolithibacter danxiaensis TaxID=3390805 RepID=UPI003BF8949E
MKEELDYIGDIAEIRSMMERSSKFLSLSGWAGILVGIYALAGAYIAHAIFNFNPDEVAYSISPTGLRKIIFLGLILFVLAISTAVSLSYKSAGKRGEKLWTPTSKLLALNMAVPLITGGILILILAANGLSGLIAPFSLLFYGLALFNASKFTYNAVMVLGLAEIALGLLSSYLIEYGLLFWALGFGIAHIIYGIYVYYKYER